MSDTDLTTPAKQALIALMLLVEETSNTVLKHHFGFAIERPAREALQRKGLIKVRKGPRNANFHELTDKGWQRARAEMAGSAPAGTGPGIKMLYKTLNVLDDLIKRELLTMEDVFQFGVLEDEPIATTPEERVIAAYQELARRPGDLVSLVPLRAKLSDIGKADLDKVLIAMDRSRTIQLDPDPNRRALPPEAREAAVRIGGEDKHLVSMDRQ